MLTVALAAGCRGLRSTAPPSADTSPPPLPPSTNKEPVAMGTRALSADHVVAPLPFDPAKLNGLSERMIRSHYENNYGGAVKNLNRVEQELHGINKDTPPFVVAALRERELTFRGSKLLHEQYFSVLGGDGKRAGEIEKALTDAYGTSAHWEEHFCATGLGLSGGSGWVVLGYELDTGTLRTIWSGNHTQSLAAFMPLLVMDMYEHSYQMDYAAASPKYIDAFFANVRWDVVDDKLARARKGRAALTS
jgi:Fe-Mn family superoxide dismutase